MPDSIANPRVLLECGIEIRASPGEAVCGDSHVVQPFPGGVLLAAMDGLGHGEEAMEAARTAVQVMEQHAGKAPDELITLCHEALMRTRGAVMTVVNLYAAQNRLDWVGVGNVEAVLLHADAGSSRPMERALLRGGLVGYQLPKLRVGTQSIAPGDILVFVTDGLKGDFTASLSAGIEPNRLAERIIEKHYRGSDDALVLVAKYVGVGYE